ncbi:MAG: hypothetical protein AB7S26_11350 [Sandaracinaceae bacterium]
MTRSSVIFVFASAIPFLVLGCDEGDPLRPDGGAGDAGPAVTFYEHVRPILSEHCVQCHRAGGIAPFALETYDDSAEVANRMVEATRDRTMPPYLADASGACNEFVDARYLDDAEIDTIAAWVREGMQAGDPATPEPAVVELPRLASVDATVDMGLEYLPNAARDDDYRCFVLEPTYSGERYLTGYDVRPGNPELVHHVILYQPVDAQTGISARNRDDMESGPGYQCFGDSGVLALPVAVWAPGAGATLFPSGTGIRLYDDRPMIMQVHYNLADAEDAPDRTAVDLSLASTVAHPAQMGLLANFSIELAPRRPEVVQDFTGFMGFAPSGDLTLWGAFPHMHTLGRQLRVENPSSGECLVDVPRWDFNWQGGYFYETPLRLQEGTELALRCTYDTMSRDETVRWGDGTADEMCLSFFYVTAD